LFSLLDAERALQGADVGIYLVHSMLPSARLTQGHFSDFDLIAADNFARAAKAVGIKRIIYLGGLIPDLPVSQLSAHLRSRYEVEEVFCHSGIPTTILRAGLIIGAEGSSFQIMYRLVNRLPVMLCPAWTHTQTQPVDLSDVVKVIAEEAQKRDETSRMMDIGCAQVMSYLSMMQTLSSLLKTKRRFLSFPAVPFWLSYRWVTFITGSPRELVAPLIQSLRYPMTLRKDYARVLPTDFESSLKNAVGLAKGSTEPAAFRQTKHSTERDVRSVIRLHLPKDKTALSVAREYGRWLPGFMGRLIQVEPDASGRFHFRLIGMKTPLLILKWEPTRSSSSRQLFYIRGGLLAYDQGRGRLEFREVLNGRFILSAIHDFRPRLPWLIYRWTQALLHLWVMRSFDRHLKSKNFSSPIPPQPMK
jgi:uncharacterized protein YbjT (DUF2867 family)